MVLAGSDCLHMISDGYDSFSRICILFEIGTPEICKVEQNIMENLKVLENTLVGQICGEGDKRPHRKSTKLLKPIFLDSGPQSRKTRFQRFL